MCGLRALRRPLMAPGGTREAAGAGARPLPRGGSSSGWLQDSAAGETSGLGQRWQWMPGEGASEWLDPSLWASAGALQYPGACAQFSKLPLQS